MTSEYRETKLSAGLGGEQVEFVAMTAIETLSEPFELELQITSPLGEIDLSEHLGEPISLKVFEEQEVARYFNGILTEAEFLEEGGDGFFYNLSLRPFTHFMDSLSGFAIYQEKNVIQILEAVFGRSGFTDFEIRTTGSYETLEYCVQYNESDFHFISRMMEQEGLYYFYEHSDEKHVMIICDDLSLQKKCEPKTLTFNASAGTAQSYRVSSEIGGHHVLETWTEKLMSSGHEKVSLRDYDFKKPTNAVEADTKQKKQHPHDTQEHYEYPGQFVDKGRASRLSKVRLEAFRALRQVYSGQTAAKGVCVGKNLSVEKHPTKRLNQEYTVISSHHVFRSQSYHSGTGAGTVGDDVVNFAAIPAKTQFRAQRKTEKPRVKGVESAIVTGPSGETIYTDKYGRIKVRFHWDREGTPDENSTCWIRVSQTGGLGNIILPRVGHEVLVDFLHGDPDQPVITGRVFNEEHMPVYSLPDNKTRAVWRTLTYGNQAAYPETEKLDTGEPKANEIRFEDKGGDEELFIHAERDMNVRVRFDTSTHIGHDEELKVGHDRERYVKNDEKVTIDGNKKYTLKKNETNEITEGNRKTTIKQGNDTLEVKMGNIKTKAAMGKITIEAMQEIELKVGKTSLKLTPFDATLSSMMIKVDGKAMTDVAAGGILTEKGALIKIN